MMQTYCTGSRSLTSRFPGDSGAASLSQGPQRGGFQRGGASRSGLVLPFLSFFCLFRDFPDLLGDGPGIFLISLSAYKEPLRGTIWTFLEKSGKHPGLENPLV